VDAPRAFEREQVDLAAWTPAFGGGFARTKAMVLPSGDHCADASRGPDVSWRAGVVPLVGTIHNDVW